MDACRGRTRVLRRIIPALLVSIAFAGCRDWNRPALAGTHASAPAVAEAVLLALRDRNIDALRALALSESEFRDHVWPELPASRPERNLPFSYVWGQLRQRSEGSLARLLAEHGGRAYTLVRANHGETTRYETFVVHRETRLTVRGADGAEQTLLAYGSVLEKGGQFKVFSYVVDD